MCSDHRGRVPITTHGTLLWYCHSDVPCWQVGRAGRPQERDSTIKECTQKNLTCSEFFQCRGSHLKGSWVRRNCTPTIQQSLHTAGTGSQLVRDQAHLPACPMQPALPQQKGPLSPYWGNPRAYSSGDQREVSCYAT